MADKNKDQAEVQVSAHLSRDQTQRQDSVKVGIIGLGDWGECHLQAFQTVPGVEVVAICDRNEERVRLMAERYGVAHAYTNDQEIYSRDDIDLVSVVTYEKSHLQPVLDSLRSGKHVLVEKPVSVVAEEVSQMARAAQEAGKMIFPGHVLRFDARYAGMKQAISSGEIGRPLSLYMKRSRKRSMFEIYKRTHTVYMSTVHDIDIALWYAGGRVNRVQAWGRTPSGADVPDLLWAMLHFDHGGVAVLESDWLTPDHAGIDNNDFAEVIGESGILRLDVASPGYHLLQDRTGRQPADFYIHYSLAGQYGGALTAQMDYVCRCVREGTERGYTSFADAVHGIEIAQAIERAIKSGVEEMI